MAKPFRTVPALAALGLLLAGCGHTPWGTASLSERECLARVMYFESNRSSESGMVAVGTVVMNRLESRRYPTTVCGVIGQRNQFADGALSKPVSGTSWTRALRVADAVLAGERHRDVGSAMFFHTTGMTFPYRNMAYVTVAGGNAFYEKRTPGTFERLIPTATTLVAENTARNRPAPTRLALAEAARPPAPRRAVLAQASTDDDDDEADAPGAARGNPPKPTIRRPDLSAAARGPVKAGRDEDDEDEAPVPTRPIRVASADGHFELPRTQLAARSRPDAPVRPVPSDRDPRHGTAVSREPGPARPDLRLAAREMARPEPAKPRASAEPPRSTRRSEPLVLSAVAGRREKAPPSIAELIALDLEKPKKR